jgi:autotransporter-associated beta strand protein
MTDRSQNVRPNGSNRKQATVAAVLAASGAVSLYGPAAQAQRVFGIDTSSAANSVIPSQTYWNRAFSDADGDGFAYKFAFVRSSRGGTSDATRLDDAHFYDNITRAAASGMLAGSYHYSRPDVTTHTAADDANHYLERAGMYMKPGYLLPVFDLEAGNTQNTVAQLTTWGMDFMNTIQAATGVLPIVYTSSSYNNDEVSAQLAWTNFGTTPKSGPRTYQWLARPSGNIRTDHPGAATNYPNPYGVWDPNFISRTNSRDPAVKPWAFWQNGSGYLEPSGASGNRFLVDYNAANGNIEFVKDFLVPALWTNAGSGDWGTISNWNSDNPAYNGTIQKGPAPRLPNNQNLDWVKLQNPAGGTVTISSGAQTVRKFYTQQPLNITGGSLSVSYLPGTGGQFNVPSEFKAAVTLSPGAAYAAHTTVIGSAGGSLTLNGGTVTFTDIQLASHGSNPGRITLAGNATFAQTGGTASSVIRSTGTLAQPGNVSLAGTATFTVNNGSAPADLDVRALVAGTGRLTKAGAGTLRLARSNTYTGGTTVNGGVLLVTADNRLGAVPVSNDPQDIILDGGTIRTGAQIDSVALTNAGTGYTSFPTLTLGGAGADAVPASANVLAGLRTIAVTSGGSGYVNQSSTPPNNGAGTFVDIVGGGGTGAAAFATVTGGVVTSITITNPGTGYTSMPTVHISSTAISGIAGDGAAASVNGITLQNIALNDGGFDYSTPTLTLTGGGGSGATATATANPNWSLHSNRGIQLGSTGGTLHQTSGSTLTYGGAISGATAGAITKAGPGTLSLTGPTPNTYAGPTHVHGGTLILEKDAALGTNVAHTFLLANSTSTIAFRAPSSSPAGFTYATQEYLMTDGSGNGTLAQVDNLAGNNTFAGSIAIGGTNDAGSIGVSAGSLTLTGGLYARGAVPAARTINKTGPGTLTLAGNSLLAPAGGATFLTNSNFNVNAGTVDLRSPNFNLPGVTTVNVSPGATLLNTTGTLADASLAVNGNFHQSTARLQDVALAVGNNATATLQPAGVAPSVLSSLTLTGTGSLDLTSNALFVDYASTSPADTVRQYLLNNQVFSSTANADPQNRFTVAYIESSLLPTQSAGAPDLTSLLLRTTYFGDANVDGTIDAGDFSLIDRGFAANAGVWWQGDFNHDGSVTSADYLLIDRVFTQQSGSFSPSAALLAQRESQFGPDYVAALVTSIPEPSSLLTACGLALPLLRRRRA